jgi:8-oxo-dGTP pyrophosphatase MutT (NUDIX family)
LESNRTLGRKLGKAGAVMTAVISPTRILLVQEERPDALWKLPGGTIEETDEDTVVAAIREVYEETGVRLDRKEMTLCSEERRAEGKYFPAFCLAEVPEEKLDTRKPINDEDGRPIKTGLFDRSEVPTMIDLLERHRGFITAIEELAASVEQ